jgi:hypothetical protein
MKNGMPIGIWAWKSPAIIMPLKEDEAKKNNPSRKWFCMKCVLRNNEDAQFETGNKYT